MYNRPVRKKRSAFFDDLSWVEVFERGKRPRPDAPRVDAHSYPPPDVYDLVLSVELTDLKRRLEVLCVALTKPNVESKAPVSSSSSLSPGQLLSGFAEIWEFLTKPTYRDGSQRHLGKVSLAVSSGGLQVTLTDVTSNSYCCVTAASLDDAFLALEVGLKDGNLPWRASSYDQGKKKKN